MYSQLEVKSFLTFPFENKSLQMRTRFFGSCHECSLKTLTTQCEVIKFLSPSKKGLSKNSPIKVYISKLDIKEKTLSVLKCK